MSIQNELNKVKNAVYGSEVRGAIHDALQKTYDDASEKGNANMEVKIARGTHPNLRSRLEEVDNKQQQTAAQLAETTHQLDVKMDKNTTDISVSQINKNKGKLDQTYMSEEFLQQISGDAPINAVPADDSITENKLANGAVSPEKLNENTKEKILNEKIYGIDITTWNVGSINTNTGVEQDLSTRLRSDFIKVDKGYSIEITDVDRFDFRVFRYSVVDGEFLGMSTYVSNYTIDEENYIRILLRYKDDRNITDDSIARYLVFTTNGIRQENFRTNFFDDLKIAKQSVIYDGSLELGALSTSSGQPSPASNRVLTYFIKVNTNDIVKIQSVVDFKYRIAHYDLSKNYKWMGVYKSNESLMVSPGYIRVILSYQDDRNITDINAFEGALEIESRTTIERYLESNGQKLVGYLDYDLRFGSLHTTSGNPIYAPDRVTTTGFLRLKQGDKIGLKNTDDIKYRVFHYDESFNIMKMNPYTVDDYVIESETLAKIILSYNDERVVSDLTPFKRALEIKREKSANRSNADVYKRINDVAKEAISVKATGLKEVYSITNLENIQFSINTNFLYNKYDALVNSRPEYVSKKTWGNTPNGVPIYEYNFKPYRVPELASMFGEDAPYIDGNLKTFKILMTSGTHGSEQGAAWATFNFFERLCNDLDNESMRYLRENVEFKILPVFNADGFNRNYRLNDNDVDLNRGFPTSGEVEHAYLKSFIEENLDADYFIDVHNTWSTISTADNLANYMMSSLSTDNMRMKNVGANVYTAMFRHWREKYLEVNSAADDFYQTNGSQYPIGYITPAMNDTIAMHIQDLYGIKSGLLELQADDVFNNATRYSDLVLECGAEVVTNIVILLVDNII